MSNLAAAKEMLEKSRVIAAIINPPPIPKKRMKLPLQRDINLVKSTLEERIEAKEKSIKAKVLEAAKAKWATEISIIHAKAVNLRHEIEQLAATVETESGGSVTIDMDSNGYSEDYWGKLPASVAEAEEQEFLELKDNKIAKIENLRKEIADHIVNIQLGLTPLSDVGILIDEIEQLQ